MSDKAIMEQWFELQTNDGEIKRINLPRCPLCKSALTAEHIGNSHTKSQRLRVFCANRDCRIERTDAATKNGIDFLIDCQEKAWQAAKEQYAPKWISVDDRLPDEAQVILVKDRIEMILKATFIRGQFPQFDTHRCVSDVTHWMSTSQLGDKE